MPPDSRKGFVKVYVDELDAPGLCANPLGLYLHLLSHARGKRYCWPSEELLTRTLGVSQATLRRHAAALENAGLIIRPRQGAKVNARNPYEITALRADLSEAEVATSRSFERSDDFTKAQLRADLHTTSVIDERTHRANLSEAIYEVDEEKEINELDDDRLAKQAPAQQAQRGGEAAPASRACRRAHSLTSEKAPRECDDVPTSSHPSSRRHRLDIEAVIRAYQGAAPTRGQVGRIWRDLKVHLSFGTPVDQVTLLAAAEEARSYVERQQNGQANNLGPLIAAIREFLVSAKHDAAAPEPVAAEPYPAAALSTDENPVLAYQERLRQDLRRLEPDGAAD